LKANQSTPAGEKSLRRWCKKSIYVVSRFIAALLAAILLCSLVGRGREIELNRLKAAARRCSSRRL